MKKSIGLLKLAAVFGLAVYLISCSASGFVGTWSEDEYRTGSIQRVLVLAMAEKTVVRNAFEKELKFEFQKIGIDAISSLEVLPPDVEIDRQTFERHFSEYNIDAVIVSRYLGTETSYQHYVDTYTIPHGYYYGFYGYYHNAWGYNYGRGYTTETKTYYVETNVYETKEGKLIWSGISETVDPSTAMDIIDDLSRMLVKKLKKDGYLAEEGYVKPEDKKEIEL
jgi:hypothetical protein